MAYFQRTYGGGEDSYTVLATALQHENDRVKRRKMDADGGVVYDTEAETLIMPETITRNRIQGGVFSNGFQIAQQLVDNSNQPALDLPQLQHRSPAQKR